MKKITFIVLITLGTLSAISQAARLPSEFKIKDEPTREDWQYFMSQSEEWRHDLWNYHVRLKENFASWGWAWRIGWLKTCSVNPSSYCREIFTAARNDEALVVRNELAKSLGLRHSDSGNLDAIAILESMLKDQRNFRNGTPLFIQETILFSLKQIGGEAKNVAKKHSKKYDKLAKYWSRLEKAG